MPSTTKQLILAIAAEQIIVAVVAVQNVHAATAVDCVVSNPATKRIVAVVANDVVMHAQGAAPQISLGTALDDQIAIAEFHIGLDLHRR